MRHSGRTSRPAPAIWAAERGGDGAASEPRVAVVALLAEDGGPSATSLALGDLVGQPLYLRSLRSLQSLRAVASLVALVPAAMADRVRREAPGGDTVPLRVVPVSTSTAAGYLLALDGVLATLPAAISVVGLHDVTIPVVEQRCWTQALAVVDGRTACAAAQPVHDTIKLAAADGIIRGTLPREELRSIQTPLLATPDVLQRTIARFAASGKGQNAGASQWLNALLAQLASDADTRLRLVPAGARSLPVRSADDLSLAANWINGGDLLLG